MLRFGWKFTREKLMVSRVKPASSSTMEEASNKKGSNKCHYLIQLIIQINIIRKPERLDQPEE